MPKDSKPVDPEAESKPVEPEAPKKPKVKLCGHLNAHYIPPAGGVRELACVLPMGHEGDHQAPYKKLMDGVLTDDTAFWSDAAGS